MTVKDLKIGDTIYSVDDGHVHIFFITNLERDPASSNDLFTVPELRINPKSQSWTIQKESYVSSHALWTGKQSYHTIEICKPIEELMMMAKHTVIRIVTDSDMFNKF